MKKKSYAKKFKAGQPLYQASRMDEVARNFYTLGRMTGSLANQREQIQQETQMAMIQRMQLFEAELNMKRMMAEIENKQAALGNPMVVGGGPPPIAGPPGLQPPPIEMGGPPPMSPVPEMQLGGGPQGPPPGQPAQVGAMPPVFG